MELLFTSDLHGSRRLYGRLGALAKTVRPDVVVLGGDLFPDGDRKSPWAEVTRYIRQDARKALEGIRETTGAEILVLAGNHDWSFVQDELGALEQAGLVRQLSYDGVVEIGGVAFLGLAESPPAPYWMKDFERRDLAADEPSKYGGYYWCEESGRTEAVTGQEWFGRHESLEELLAKAPVPGKPWVFVAHAPPAGTGLDLQPGIRHCGSRAVREFIERHNPILSLHGHFHDSPRLSGHCTERIGRCLSVNPGQTNEALCAIQWRLDRPDEIRHSLGWSP
jgi:Icc-related predicted phosphoesterase